MKYTYLLFLISFSALAHHPITNDEKACAIKNLYHEARGESEQGQFLILDVVNNRSQSKYYPHNWCDVIYQKAQFSWTLEPQLNPYNKKILERLYYVVERYYNSDNVTPKNILWYHNTTVNPYWVTNLTKVAVVGNHIFYKSK